MSKDWWHQTGGMPWGYMAFGRPGRFFETGEIRLAILSLLSEGPKHGYQLMKEMEERSGGMYRSSAGSVYPTLQQLEDEELIRSDQQSGKRVYSLTEAGLRELERDPDAVRRIWQRAEQWEEWRHCMNPSLMWVIGPLAVTVRAAWSAAGRVSGKNDGEVRVRDILDRARRDLEHL